MYVFTSTVSGLFGIVFLAAWLVLTVASLLNLFRTAWLNAGSRILWSVVIIVVPIIGALVYLFWKKVKRVEN